MERMRRMNTMTFKIEGMHCEGCAERIHGLVSREPGVRGAEVSFATGTAEIRFNRHRIDEKRLREVIEAGGFSVVGSGA